MSIAFDKLLKGELLTENEKQELTLEELEEAKTKRLGELSALTEEKKRREERNKEDEKKSTQQQQDFAKKIVEENTQKAEFTLFNELQSKGVELTEENKQKIRDIRKKLDEGEVTYDNILEKFWSAYAVVDRQSLFKDREMKSEFEKQAAEYSSSNAGGGSGSPTGGDNKYPKEVLDYVNEARKQGVSITPDEALRILTKGNRRVY